MLRPRPVTNGMEPIRWSELEYEERHHGADWYWALGIIAVASAATSIILGNVLFAIVIVIGALVLSLHAARRPEEIEFEINESGIVIGSRLYPFRTLESFWIPEEGVPRLIVHSKRIFVPQIVIPFSDEVSLDDVHDVLLEYLEEEEHSESLSERFAEWFGF